MAESLGVKPHPNKVFLYRLYSLITDAGVLVYRKKFTEFATRISGSVSDHLDRYRVAIQESFLQRRINGRQFDRLFPNRVPAVSVDTCDITLLAFLVQITCVETADETLRLEVSDLDKLRRYRNEIAHIHSTEEYDESSFEQFWRRIKVEIMKLGRGIHGLEEEIDALKVNPIDPKREAELQQFITDHSLRAEVAEDLKNEIAEMKVFQNKMMTQMSVAAEKNEKKQNDMIDSLSALTAQLQQICIDPSRQLSYSGDSGPDSGIAISLNASLDSPSFHCERKRQYKQLVGPGGPTFVTTFQQVLTKGTVTAFRRDDYEDLSKAIGSEWLIVAQHLGLTKNQIDRMKVQFARSDNYAHIEEIVHIWGEREKEQATIDRFINIVVDCQDIKAERSAFDAIIGRHC